MRKELFKKRSPFILLLLFLISFSLSPAIAQINVQHPITQQTASQLGNQATHFYETGQFSRAVIFWKQTAAAFANQGDNLNQARSLSNLSLTYQQLGEWDSAKEAIAQSLAVLETEDNSENRKSVLAETLNFRGKLELAIGETESALTTWTKTANLYQQLEDNANLNRTKINQAQAFQDLGLYPRACQSLLQVLALDNSDCNLSEANLQNIPKPDSMIRFDALHSLGNLLRLVGDLEASKTVLKMALEFDKKPFDSEDRALVYLSLGNTERALAEREALFKQQEKIEPRHALCDYNQALNFSTSPFTQFQVKLNQLSLFIEVENWRAIESLWPELKQQNFSEFPLTRTAIYIQTSLAVNFFKLWDKKDVTPPDSLQITNLFNDLDKLLVNAKKRATDLKDEQALAYAIGYRGSLYEHKNQWDKAEDLTKKALISASSFQRPNMAYQWQWQLGRIRNVKEDRNGAIAAYSNAFQTLQSLRGDLVAIAPEVQFNFRDNVEPFYRQYVELLLQDPSSQDNLKAARRAIQALQLAELNDFFGDACTATKEDVDSIVDEAPRPTAVIYPIIFPDHLEIILKLPKTETLEYYRTPTLAANELGNTLRNLQRDLPHKDRTELVRSSAQKVYQWLIQPLEETLKQNQIKTLVFVLDGRLRNIPMAVLYDGEKYLIEKYAIALTPGLQLLPPQPLAQLELNALTGGISEEREVEGRAFNPLENVEHELQEIQTAISQNQTLLNFKFTTDNLKDKLDETGFPVIHLATHGKFSSNPEETFILTWEKLLKVKEFDQLLRSSDRRDRQALELLVLSACETADGDERAALGLAGVAIKAGARSTLATLWQVDDEKTAKILIQFYRELLKDNVTKAEALQNAQSSFLARYKRPYYWGAYTLIGNWL